MTQQAKAIAAPSTIIQPLMMAAGFAAIFVGLADPHPADKRAELSLQAEEHQMISTDARAGFADVAGAMNASAAPALTSGKRGGRLSN